MKKIIIISIAVVSLFISSSASAAILNSTVNTDIKTSATIPMPIIMEVKNNTSGDVKINSTENSMNSKNSVDVQATTTVEVKKKNVIIRAWVWFIGLFN